MSLTIVSYAINGRGLGHLTRQLAILRWIRRYAGVLGTKVECWVVTSSEADTLARREGIPALKMPSKSMMRDAGIDPARYLAIARTWVLNAVAGLRPDLLVVDTFPGGTFGELVPVLELAPRRALVARKVRDTIAGEDAYRALLPLYDKVIVPDEAATGSILIRDRDELAPREEARQALGIPPGERSVYVTLGGGGDPAAGHTIPRLVETLVGRGWHVVVGAGPLYTGPERRGAGITWLERYCAMELLPGVDVAVSAGGYNAFHELMHAGVPTVFLPQPRIADDQAERVDRAVAKGAGHLAPRIEDVPELLERLAANPGASAAARALVPENGARRAAAALLSMLLPADDIAAAAAVFSPSLFAHPAARALDPNQLLDAVRLFAGDAPSVWANRKATVLELADRGMTVDGMPSAPKPARVERFLDLCAAVEVPPHLAVQLAQQLQRRFPAARPIDLLDACEALFPVFARLGDWMGVLALVRAFSTQRQYPLDRFVHDLGAWLENERDAFDALRAFSRLEGGGKRPTAEVLAILSLGRPVDIDEDLPMERR